MPRVEAVRSAYDQRVAGARDLNDMIATPRSPAQFDALIQDLRVKLELTKASELMDVGCGNGDLLRRLLPMVKSGAGCDISETLLFRAKDLTSHTGFTCTEAVRLPFSDSVFDRILTYSTFMHFPDQRYAFNSIRELCRVCRDGGVVLIGDLPNKALRRKIVTRRWEIQYRLKVLLRRHPGPSIFNPLQWRFYDLGKLARFAKSLGHQANVLVQPSGLLCADHRTDLVIHIRKQ